MDRCGGCFGAWGQAGLHLLAQLAVWLPAEGVAHDLWRRCLVEARGRCLRPEGLVGLFLNRLADVAPAASGAAPGATRVDRAA